MKRNLAIVLAALAATTLLASCSKGGAPEAPLPDISAAVVSQEALAEAVWGTAEAPSPEADCLAGSSFTIAPDNGFTIMKIYETNKYGRRIAKVNIVTDLSITFDDPASDARGAACGDGVLTYTVPATAETPMIIENAPATAARQSVVNQAKESSTSYPKCTITAHFDKDGTVLCVTDEPTETPVEQTDEVVDDTETTPDDTADDTADDSADDDSSDDPIVFTPITPVGSLHLLKAQTLDENDGVPCGTEEVHRAKLIIDDVNCRQVWQPRVIQH